MMMFFFLSSSLTVSSLFVLRCFVATLTGSGIVVMVVVFILCF